MRTGLIFATLISLTSVVAYCEDPPPMTRQEEAVYKRIGLVMTQLSAVERSRKPTDKQTAKSLKDTLEGLKESLKKGPFQVGPLFVQSLEVGDYGRLYNGEYLPAVEILQISGKNQVLINESGVTFLIDGINVNGLADGKLLDVSRRFSS